MPVVKVFEHPILKNLVDLFSYHAGNFSCTFSSSVESLSVAVGGAVAPLKSLSLNFPVCKRRFNQWSFNLIFLFHVSE